MNNLPISPLLSEIVSTVASSSNVVLQADPGAGKSTAVPLAVLLSDWFQSEQNADKKIIMLEPRRLAVRSIARYLAKQLGEKVGERVGYQVRNEKVVSEKTRLEIVTEGILTRRLQSDPELGDVALVIFDEFHERSIHADLALTLCLDSQSALNEELKMLVMSATIDTEAVSKFLDGAPVIRSEGRAYPVATHYLPQTLPSNAKFKWDVLPLLKGSVMQALQQSEKDMLVFLAGQGEIKQTQQALQESLNENEFSVLPLYGGLKPEQQDQAIQPDPQGRRKIVLTTNIAETSLTIEGIDCVVDSGFARKLFYDVNSGMSRLQIQRISAASAEQRKGRAGRLYAGVCYRLWSESQQAQLSPFEVEEILVTDLSDLCLELAQWGVQDVKSLRWLTEPPAAHFQQAQQLLAQLDLLNDKGQITRLGEQAMTFACSPRLAKLLLADKKTQSEQITRLACDVAALLSERDVLQDRDSGADLTIRVLALQAYRQDRNRAKRDYPILISAMEQALLNSRNWQRQLGLNGKTEEYDSAFLQNEVGKLVAQAFPDRVALQRKGGHRYLLANGRGATLEESDPLSRESCLAVANIDGQAREGRVFLAAPLDKNEIETLFAGHIDEGAVYQYDEARNEVIGSVQRRYQALVLAEERLQEKDEAALQQCLLETVKAKKLSLLPWNETNQAWLNRVRWLASQDGASEKGLPDFSDVWLLDNLEEWLGPYLAGVGSVKALKKIDLLPILQAQLPYEMQQALEQEAPKYYVAPSGKKVAVRYAVGQNPTVSVQLQELFGELASPRLAWGSVPLTFELLSPARRPIQVTSDLENFWKSSYFEVAKEMRGRYPKHRWPEEPLLEKAGRSIKPRN
ncbi:ATP-dependent helicase HrpB [Thiomicrorhabdus sp.]|uniref:ATP-dependent helicase HrpB n=1 Tax=Thiomicrorhabdus sp. TaxID=2039724 RepID=UPI003565C0B3